MSTLLKAGDSEPEQPLREGWLVKQSGGAATRVRRRSVGEIMKKWDERYFVLTTQRLYYFKTMEVSCACNWLLRRPAVLALSQPGSATASETGAPAHTDPGRGCRTSSAAATRPASSQSKTTWSRALHRPLSSGETS
jgi:hypothetical protein